MTSQPNERGHADVAACNQARAPKFAVLASVLHHLVCKPCRHLLARRVVSAEAHLCRAGILKLRQKALQLARRSCEQLLDRPCNEECAVHRLFEIMLALDQSHFQATSKAPTQDLTRLLKHWNARSQRAVCTQSLQRLLNCTGAFAHSKRHSTRRALCGLGKRS